MSITYQEDEYTEEEAEGMWCERCGHGFEIGERAYDFGDEIICEDCVEDYVDNRFGFVPYPEEEPYYPDEDMTFEEWRDAHPEEWERQLAKHREENEERIE